MLFHVIPQHSLVDWHQYKIAHHRSATQHGLNACKYNFSIALTSILQENFDISNNMPLSCIHRNWPFISNFLVTLADTFIIIIIIVALTYILLF
jgi:hypothetical protein